MGSQHHRDTSVLPPRAARHCCRLVLVRAYGGPVATTAPARHASLQRTDIHGWHERCRAQVRLLVVYAV